jgi:hypothetical protein
MADPFSCVRVRLPDRKGIGLIFTRRPVEGAALSADTGAPTEPCFSYEQPGGIVKARSGI